MPQLCVSTHLPRLRRESFQRIALSKIRKGAPIRLRRPFPNLVPAAYFPFFPPFFMSSFLPFFFISPLLAVWIAGRGAAARTLLLVDIRGLASRVKEIPVFIARSARKNIPRGSGC